MKRYYIFFILTLGLWLTSCRESFIDVPEDPLESSLDDILYAKSAPGGAWEIVTCQSDGTNERPLLSLPENALYLSQPVGSEYLYYNFQIGYPGPNLRRLMKVNVDSTEQILVKNIADLEYAVLSNDAKKIAYTVHSQNKHELRLMNVDGTEDILLSQGIDDGFTPAFSPNGSMIAFVRESSKGGPGGNHTDSLQVVTLDGTLKKTLYVDREGFDKSTLRWSPDGKYILVIGDDRLYRQLLLISTDGSFNKRALTSDKSFKSQASFSPDGNTIAYLVGDYGMSYVATIPIEGGSCQNLYADNNCQIKDVSFSNDNTKILFISEDNRIVPPDSTGKHDMKVLDISTKTTQTLSSHTYIARWKR